MNISSRTPEGHPNRCPVCGSEICVEPSRPLGDAPCPACGVLLLYETANNQTYYFDQSLAPDKLNSLVETIGQQLQMTPEMLFSTRAMQDWRDRAIDLVEAVMELEDELRSTEDS